VLVNQRATDMYLEGNSNAAEADQKVKMIIGAENALIFYISRAHLIKKRMQVCYDHNMPMRLIKTAPIWSTNLELDKKGIKVRFLTDIRNENLEYCKTILQEIKHVEMRHMEGIRGNFTIHDGEEMFLPFFVDRPGELLNEMLYSSQKQMVDAYVFMFDKLWHQATPAHIRIRELETGIQPEVLHTIKDPNEIIEIGNNLVKSARKEILLLFHTANAMLRQTKSGIIDLIIENAIKYKTKVKILVPIEDKIKDILHRLEQISGIQIRNIEQSMQTRVTILVVDKVYSLVIEIKDDTKQSSNKAIGLAAYSNSKSTVLSYVSIFESLWKYSELREELLIQNMAQKEFINIAAHELRNPIQPILGLSEILSPRVGEKNKEYIDVIIRNAKRLERLSEDILDTTRIEAKTLNLNKQSFSFIKAIGDIVNDYSSFTTEISKKYINSKVTISFSTSEDLKSIDVVADQDRIKQVLSNLVNNSLKFTKNGTITITAEIDKKCYNHKETHQIIVKVKDTGIGIDLDIFPRLFSKFVTKSNAGGGGTGLGLYICKGIIESHGGKIWAENNKDGEKGATFSFSLPLAIQQQQQ
jgi:two-component system, OmpR family, sensor histidine kinase VicK